MALPITFQGVTYDLSTPQGMQAYSAAINKGTAPTQTTVPQTSPQPTAPQTTPQPTPQPTTQPATQPTSSPTFSQYPEGTKLVTNLNSSNPTIVTATAGRSYADSKFLPFTGGFTRMGNAVPIPQTGNPADFRLNTSGSTAQPQQPASQTGTGFITFMGTQYNLSTPEGMAAYSQAINNPQQAQQPVQQPVVQPTQPVQQAPQQAPQAPQQGGQFINANGAYFQQTASGLQLVNDPATLQQLMSGQIPSTSGGLGSQQLTGMTRPDLIPESARNATAEQGLQFVAQSNPQLAESIMSSLGYTGTPEGFDAQYGTMAQTNPLEFVQSVYSQLIQNSGLMDIKAQFENFTTKVEELTNDMNDEIADINDNPWLVEGVRIKRIQRVQEKYEGRINSATASMKYLSGLYSDGLAEARFLTQQTMSIYNDQVDFEQQLYRDALMRAEDRADAQTKMEFDLQKAAMTKAGGKEVEDNQTSQMVNQVLDGFQKIGDLTPSAQQKVKTELYGMGFGSDTPPEWFREFIQDQRQMTLTPTALQSEWIKYRDSIMKQSSTTSGGVSFDDL